jgi:dipeptidase
MVRLQYIEIPQVNVTWAWIGFKTNIERWGVGMGINEWGIAVADNDAPTREPLEGFKGLHDNDSCRLILERCKTAREGVELVGYLIETYGHANTGEIYFIADPQECWIVEATGHHWAAVRVRDGVAVRGNQFEIGEHWDMGSKDLIEYAIEMGWCSSPQEFNFAECYSPEGYPYRRTRERTERVLDLLGPLVGSITPRDLMEVLRDHYEGTSLFYEAPHHNPRHRAICIYRTVASMVAHLRPGLPREMQIIWCCMASPCTGVYIPVYASTQVIPEPYLKGLSTQEEYVESAWWAFKRIQVSVEKEQTLQPKVKAIWEEFMEETERLMLKAERDAQRLLERGKREEGVRLLGEFVEDRLLEAYSKALALPGELQKRVEESKTRLGPLILLIPIVSALIILLIGVALLLRRRCANPLNLRRWCRLQLPSELV